MAKKTTEVDTEATEATVAVDTEAVAEPAEEMVTIKLPISKENQADQFVRVNNRTWLIKRGEFVTVPKCVCEVLENSEKAILESIEYQNSVEKTIPTN